MTVLTKANFGLKPSVEPPEDKKHFVEDGQGPIEDGEIVVLHRKSAGSLSCVVVLLMLVFGSTVLLGLLIFDGYKLPQPRYKGYCSIPIDIVHNNRDPLHDQIIAERNRHRSLPVQWSRAIPHPEVFDADAEAAESFTNALKEEFDVGGRVEKIKVFDNGRTVSFIHDFDNNITGIVDSDRCFFMDLDPSLVLAPETLVFAIENGQDFDVSRVHSTLRAILPAVMDLTRHARMITDRCQARPTYQLNVSGSIIRKRSTDPLHHDYIHFAGRHIQEISIENLGDVIQHEAKNK